MDEIINKIVSRSLQSEIFTAIGYAALKARASRLEPGAIIRNRGFEITVAEDEDGQGIVVQIIETIRNIEELASIEAKIIGLDIEKWNAQEHREWMTSFKERLKSDLHLWRDIEMYLGPGDNFTFEKSVYKGTPFS